MHEGYRKDVEQAFGVLQARFVIIKTLARFLDKQVLYDIIVGPKAHHSSFDDDQLI